MTHNVKLLKMLDVLLDLMFFVLSMNLLLQHLRMDLINIIFNEYLDKFIIVFMMIF